MNARQYQLEVWGPNATRVGALVGDKEIEMSRDPSRPGWWLSRESYTPGTRYGFLLDGKGPFPDPRSRFQPEGIHGLSQVIDLSDHEWSDVAWKPTPWTEAVVYEAHVGTFSPEGTFEGMIPHLDDIIRLGITHLELLPVCEFPGSRNWGYDCVSINSANHIYGGPEGLMELIDECHSRGLAVIIDVVYNHMGPEGNYLGEFGPYFSGPPTAWGSGPTMEGDGHREVRDFFIQNALMWLRDYRADGLRLDAIDKIVDNSDRHFLVELREAVDQLGQETWPRVLIAESAQNDPVFVLPIAEGGYGMDAHWVDDVHHAIRTTFTGESQAYYADFNGAVDLVKALHQGFVYDGQVSKHQGKPRGKSPAGLPPSSFLICFQNHDQIGNRPHGDRFHQRPGADPLHQKIGSALVLLSPFTPMIFMGEEWAASTPFQFFTDHQDPKLAASVGQGRKDEFGGEEWNEDVPDPQDLNCFLKSKLIWSERTEPDHRCMSGWYSELLRLRKSNGAAPSFAQVDADLEQGWIRMRKGRYAVIAAYRNHIATTPFPLPEAFGPILSAGQIRTSPEGKLEFIGPGVIVVANDHER